MRRPEMVVTCEPFPVSKTSVVRRPMPLATCLTPNWDSFAAAVAVAMSRAGVGISREEVEHTRRRG